VDNGRWSAVGDQGSGFNYKTIFQEFAEREFIRTMPLVFLTKGAGFNSMDPSIFPISLQAHINLW
jgi:hypothetical protein